MKVAKNILDLIGNTPLLKLSNITKDSLANVYGKCEFINPLGSVKDRTALAMIEAAEKAGDIKKGTLILEATSGNTGIGLAFVGAIKGYKVILTMPDGMSLERRKLLKALGAELVLTPAHLGMNGAIDKLKEIAKEHKNSFITQQFDNEANPTVHYTTTGPEIDSALDGKVDILVAGVGTGGTLAGISRYFKEKNPNFVSIAVEPKDSAVLSGNEPGPHRLQGIGAGFIPGNIKDGDFNEVFKVGNEDAVKTTRRLAKEEGTFVGISAGANVFAALEIAKRPENKGKNIVTILCDFGERYLSTTLFDS
ncbi:cysteine synthase A [Candidatus Marinamargulisbacteria bacterium SCGC AAA071-K20]|nr:cysteine synthase A [Candidatus Marinamargulisbacteria bacterium SCGC AAA071-K20]